MAYRRKPTLSGEISLIVGLGNPGAQYETTRHNVGFWFVEALARSYGGQFRAETKFFGEVARVGIEGRSVWLLKPTTFMNRSGQAVAALARFYKIPLESILVVHDELDLDPGVARLKQGGGHGGHNGLRDIIAQMGGKDFKRLRLGIGHPGVARDVSNYVLSRPPASEELLIEEALAEAQAVLPWVVKGDFQKAMNRLHSAK